jgi:hypothetical protein
MPNAASILGYGAIGLGFLLAWLAYRLLLQEQRVREPRANILKSIYFFECFCVVLVLFGAVLQYFDNTNRSNAFVLSNKITALESELQSTKSNISGLQTRAESAGQCEAKLAEYASINLKLFQSITNSTSIVAKVQADLVKQNSLAVNDSCSGGPNGIPTNHSAEITSLNTSISSDVANLSGVLASAKNLKKPD